MAEERLIDDDKDRKYKIRINADGEEELVIDDSPEEEETDIPVFAVPELDGDDEDAAALTPEQLAERQRLREEEERRAEERVAALLKEAREKLAAGSFEGALYAVNQAAELKECDGEIYCLKLQILSRNFNDYTALNECAEAAEGVKEYATAEQKAELKKHAAGLKARTEAARARTESLKEENEGKKAERREVFSAARKKESIKLAAAGAPFLAFLILAVSFCSVMFSAENGLYLVLTIVFAALTAVAFVITVIMLHSFWGAQRNCSLNERDKSTKLGRQYLEAKAELEKLEAVGSAIEG